MTEATEEVVLTFHVVIHRNDLELGGERVASLKAEAAKLSVKAHILNQWVSIAEELKDDSQ